VLDHLSLSINLFWSYDDSCLNVHLYVITTFVQLNYIVLVAACETGRVGTLAIGTNE